MTDDLTPPHWDRPVPDYALERAKAEKYSQPSLELAFGMTQKTCTLGVGCDDYGICYADAHGEPSQCGRINHAEERAKAEKDSHLLGTGFLIDGVHVSPSRVTMLRKAYWPHVTTTELYDDLAQVLRDKGASDEWIAYALPQLQLAATQYAATRWFEGYKAGQRGDPIPNPQGPVEDIA